MPSRNCWAITVLLAFFYSTSANAFFTELEDRKWFQVQTANFEIYSQLSKKDTLKLARHLETFRQVAALFTGVGLQDSPVPTVIYAVRGGKASKDLSLDLNFAGRFYPGLRRNWILVRDVRGMNETATIMHEYVHFLISNYADYNVPMWFNEGFAEYLSSMRIRSDEVIIGGVTPERAQGFGNFTWIPLKLIIARRPSDEWPGARDWVFYSEAWALVHYLMNRTDQQTRFSDQLMSYIVQLDAGADSLESFETVFGVSVEKLDRDVRNYLAGNRVPGVVIPADAVMTDFEPAVTRMSREQVSLALARLALLQGEFDHAERWYSIAAEDPALEAHAVAGIGDTMKYRDRTEEALLHFERALDLAPDDPLCHLDMAEFWDYQAIQAEEPEQRGTFIGLAREHYVRAWQLNPKLPETYAMYGRSFLLKGDNYDQAVTMLEEAQRLLRSNLRIKFMLAQAYDGAGRPKEAGIAAQSLLSWVHGESEAAEEARRILARSVTDTVKQGRID